MELSLTPANFRCLFRATCPVIMPTRQCISHHLRDSAYLVTAKSGPFRNILACLHVEFSVHNHCCSLCAQARAAALIEHMGTPKNGSGPINVVLATFFARPSTISFTGTPQCPGTHNSLMLLQIETLLTASITSATKLDVTFTASSAFSAA